MLLSVETLFAKGIADIAEALPSNFGFKLTRGDVLEDSQLPRWVLMQNSALVMYTNAQSRSKL